MIDIIIQEVGEYCVVSLHEMISSSRKGNLVKARQLIFYFARELTQMSLADIGSVLFRDHATVMHGERMVRNYIQTYDIYKKEVEILRSRIEEAIRHYTLPCNEVFMENDFFTNN